MLPCNNELRYLSIKWKSVDKICEISVILVKYDRDYGEKGVKTQIIFYWTQIFPVKEFFFSNSAGLQFTTLLIINSFFHKYFLRFMTRHGE